MIRSQLSCLLIIGFITYCYSFQATNSYVIPHVTKTFIADQKCLTPHQRRHRVDSYNIHQLSPDTITATSTLVISSGIGFASDRLNLCRDSGLIITLVLAAALSNLGLMGFAVPSVHPIYDLCWSRILPASLALIIFSSSSETSGINGDETFFGEDGRRYLNTRELIVAVGIPFFIGSVGSILGCILSASFQIWAGSIGILSKIAMTPLEASFAAGCLTASYIGGTVNFFAAARIISKQIEVKGMNNLLSAMAAADLIVMAVYFGIMTKLMSWSKLHKWFPSRDTNLPLETGDGPIETKRNSDKLSIVQSISVLIMVVLAWFIVELSSSLETITSPILPGMQCAFVAVFGSIMNQVIKRLSRPHHNPFGRCIMKFKYDINKLAPPVSGYCFYLLFAAIGTSADLSRALTFGLPCIAFASLSLIVHIFIIFLGSSISSRILPVLIKSNYTSKIFPFSIEEICVASNAAIGGASTAAALAGKSKSKNRSGLVIASTFWGIFGYAISTTIGVCITLLLISKT